MTIHTINTALKLAPKVLDILRVYITNDVLLLAVIYCLMSEAASFQ